MGTIFSPVTWELMTWPPSVARLEHALTEQVYGHELPEQLTQCCAHDPQAHERTPVPPLFFHPVAVIPIFSSFPICGLIVTSSGTTVPPAKELVTGQDADHAVPTGTPIDQAFEAGGTHDGSENLGKWVTSGGERLASLDVFTSARRLGTRVYALVST
jgi:hypothetical protein